MVLALAARCWSQWRACRPQRAVVLAIATLAIGLSLPRPALSQSVAGEASLSAASGYARLIVKLAEDVESEVSTAGSVLVIRFKKPVAVPVETLADAVPDYVSSVRRDPDGSAIRFALSRKVTVNAMAAGERLFVDLLPESWQGAPPSLPQDVIKELAERARVAERALRDRRTAEANAKRPPIRVRASLQPTFVRFVFELPEGVKVSSSLAERKLTLQFSPTLVFDLADAKLAAPASVASIAQKTGSDAATVDLALLGNVDIRSFRDDRNYIVDVGFQPAEKSASDPIALPVEATKPKAEHDVQPKAHDEQRSDGSHGATKATNVAVVAAPPVEQGAPAASSEHVAQPDQQVQPAEPAARTPQHETEAPKAPAAEPATATAKTEAPAEHATAAAAGSLSVDAKRSSDALRLTFSAPRQTPAAMFRQSDILWLVLDTTDPIDISAIRREAGALVSNVSVLPLDGAQAIRIRLGRPQMASLAPLEAGSQASEVRNGWVVTLADVMQTPSLPLTAARVMSDATHAKVVIPIEGAGQLHRLRDPDAGDALLVVTANSPARGFIKRQSFVDFSILDSIHGVVVAPNADDVTADLAADKLTIGRSGGLTLSSAGGFSERALIAERPIFEADEWRRNVDANFLKRQDSLIARAAQANDADKTPARIDLARFYIARMMYHEAKAVLDLAIVDTDAGKDDALVLVLHSIACTLMGRPERGLKDLANPAVGSKFEAPLWRALALSRSGKSADAREKFKSVELAGTSLPLDMQRIVAFDAMRASLDVKDYTAAEALNRDLEVMGLPPFMASQASVMRGRLAEAVGHEKDALDLYDAVFATPDRPAAAEAKLLAIALRQKRNEIAPEDAVHDLESLSLTWRGDALEVRTSLMLLQAYAAAGRYDDALSAARTATLLQPNSEPARQAQTEAAALFAQIFLGTKGDELQPINALALFYDFRALTPIGRRGDEMIRRLADRLVAVDLLDQASELLQYQIDHRLEGAARAQVAAKAAMVYLMNRKPDRAIAALRATRIAELAGELRQQRLLLEARAQSDIGRHDLALDIISNLSGREAVRLRSDIEWASRRWRESAEQIELYYGDRWQNFKPLNAVEKADVVRAVIGYALAEDALGLGRFREKYAPLMADAADHIAFDVASKPASGGSAEFVQIARIAARVDTLEGFLQDMKSRFPDMTAKATPSPDTQKADPAPTGSIVKRSGPGLSAAAN